MYQAVAEHVQMYEKQARFAHPRRWTGGRVAPGRCARPHVVRVLKRNETGAEAAGFQLMVVGWWLMRIYVPDKDWTTPTCPAG